MRVITLTTDFGAASLYVAQLHASILSAIAAETNVAPRIVDITHAVPPQDIRQGAIAIGECCPLFPLGSIHVGVVDPGVGSDRAIVACRCDGHFYVAPDNGLLSRVASPRPADFAAVEVTDSRFWRAEVSSTFHGRDMMAPVAAHLARGVELAEFGPASASLQLLDLPSALSTSDEIRGQVERVDSFGNLITNIGMADLRGDRDWAVACATELIRGISRTYSDGEGGDLIALAGSGGRLEIAVVGGNAAVRTGVGVGESVKLCKVEAVEGN